MVMNSIIPNAESYVKLDSTGTIMEIANHVNQNALPVFLMHNVHLASQVTH